MPAGCDGALIRLRVGPEELALAPESDWDRRFRSLFADLR